MGKLIDRLAAPTTSRINSAISESFTVSGTDAYTLSASGTFSYTYLTGKAIDITIPLAQINTGSSTLDFDGLGAKNIQKWSGGSLVDVSAGDLIGTLSIRYDGTQWVVDGSVSSGGSTFASDVTFVLESGNTFGKYGNGDTATWTGLTAVQAILDAAIDYINPAFTSFSVSGQSTTVEVGTTLSGSKTFTWAITVNSGVVSTIDLYDITAGATLLAGTPNDGSQSQAVTSNQLNSNGSTQSWRGIANNTSPVGTVNSSPFTVTSRFYRWYAPVSATPSNSAAVRALAGQAFQTAGNSFTLATGTVEIIFSVNLPPSVTIVSAIDTTNFDVDLTADFVLIGTVNVTDAGGTTRAYNQYEYNIAVPYGTSANIVILTN